MKGVYCPSVSLFDNNKKLDIAAMKQYWARLIDSGINGVVILGTIGENTELDISEKLSLIDTANDVFSDVNTELIVGCSSANVDESVLLAQVCNDMTAVDAILAMPAYYFGLTQNAVVRHMEVMCNASTKPVIAYNFPDRNGIDISVDTLKELKEKFEHFIGVKNTTKNVESTMVMISELEDDRFTVYAGFDEHFMPTLMSGGSSVISGLVNIIPEVFVSLVYAFESQDQSRIKIAHKNIIDELPIYRSHPHFVAAIKNELLQRGVIENSTYKGVY